MMTMASTISASVPQSFDLGFDFGPAFLLVMLAVLVVGILGTLLSVSVAEHQTKEQDPYISLHLRPILKTE